MAKKVAPEQVVMDFFETADPIKVETVFNIIKGTVRRRLSPTATKTVKPNRTTKGTTKAPEVHTPAATAAETVAE